MPYAQFEQHYPNVLGMIDTDDLPKEFSDIRSKRNDTVIFLEDKETKSFGGCFVGKFLGDVSNDHSIAVISNIFFELDEDSELHDDDNGSGFFALVEEFYNELYLAIAQYKVSLKKKIYTCLRSEEHNDSQRYGAWYYDDCMTLNAEFILAKLDFPDMDLRAN